ncbi:MAG TPA: type II secretion system protein GspJ [Desulfurivibrionaceae bacterium]|nr:type II secretion system protein GspJ [Desulfurivibrionaceae bacterium]
MCRNSRGFTLIEVLLAVALTGVIVAALYGTFFSLTRGQERATRDAEARRELRGTLDLIRREIDAAWFQRSDTRLRFVVEDRDRFGKPVSGLELTCIAPPGGAGATDQVLVRYRPIERENRLLLARELKDLHHAGDPVAYPQMEALESFLVECFDGSRWLRTWDASQNGGMPQQVRITITVKDGEREVPYSIIATPRIKVN